MLYTFCYSGNVIIDKTMKYKLKTFRIPIEHAELLERVARTKDLTASQIVRRLIADYITENI